MSDDATLASAARVLHGLATVGSTSGPSSASQFPPFDGVNGVKTLVLPGANTAGKRVFEQELNALISRVQLLEAKANGQTLPDTPNESTTQSPFSDKNAARHQLVTSLLGPKEPSSGQSAPQVTKLTDEELEALREHVADQSKLLNTQKVELAGVNAQLLEQKKLQEQALKAVEVARVAALERELRKHQQANEAFQKALREIGEIVTAVARGDLSKKVQIHSVEMDPEITTFKRTINTMMDQLQVFSSEVSRVAREVGTEGILGGQAQISGVDGTWKELTNNGKRG